MKQTVKCNLDILLMFYHRGRVLSLVKMSVLSAAGLHGLGVIPVVRAWGSDLGSWLEIAKLLIVQVDLNVENFLQFFQNKFRDRASHAALTVTAQS